MKTTAAPAATPADDCDDMLDFSWDSTPSPVAAPKPAAPETDHGTAVTDRDLAAAIYRAAWYREQGLVP